MAFFRCVWERWTSTGVIARAAQAATSAARAAQPTQGRGARRPPAAGGADAGGMLRGGVARRRSALLLGGRPGARQRRVASVSSSLDRARGGAGGRPRVGGRDGRDGGLLGGRGAAARRAPRAGRRRGGGARMRPASGAPSASPAAAKSHRVTAGVSHSQSKLAWASQARRGGGQAGPRALVHPRAAHERAEHGQQRDDEQREADDPELPEGLDLQRVAVDDREAGLAVLGPEQRVRPRPRAAQGMRVVAVADRDLPVGDAPVVADLREPLARRLADLHLGVGRELVPAAADLVRATGAEEDEHRGDERPGGDQARHERPRARDGQAAELRVQRQAERAQGHRDARDDGQLHRRLVARVEGVLRRMGELEPLAVGRVADEHHQGGRRRGGDEPREHRARPPEHQQRHDADHGGEQRPARDREVDDRAAEGDARGGDDPGRPGRARVAGDRQARDRAQRADQPGGVPVARRPAQPLAQEVLVDPEAIGQQPHAERGDRDRQGAEGDAVQQAARPGPGMAEQAEDDQRRRVEQHAVVLEQRPRGRVGPPAGGAGSTPRSPRGRRRRPPAPA